jgi:hypothetical protein
MCTGAAESTIMQVLNFFAGKTDDTDMSMMENLF